MPMIQNINVLIFTPVQREKGEHDDVHIVVSEECFERLDGRPPLRLGVGSSMIDDE